MRIVPQCNATNRGSWCSWEAVETAVQMCQIRNPGARWSWCEGTKHNRGGKTEMQYRAKKWQEGRNAQQSGTETEGGKRVGRRRRYVTVLGETQPPVRRRVTSVKPRGNSMGICREVVTGGSGVWLNVRSNNVATSGAWSGNRKHSGKVKCEPCAVTVEQSVKKMRGKPGTATCVQRR